MAENTPKPPPGKLLRDAAKLIEQVLVQLDTSSTECGQCKLLHYNNLVHHKADSNLQALPARLRREAALLERTPTVNDADYDRVQAVRDRFSPRGK